MYPLPLALARCQHGVMNTSPTRPGEPEKVDPETERIIRERLATFDEDVKTAVDAKQVIAEIRKSLKHAKPS